MLEVQGRNLFISDLYARSLDVMKDLRDSAIEKRNGPKSVPRFSISETADLVGRSVTAIREAEKENRLPQVERKQSGRRIGYTLHEVNQMRALFGTIKWRQPTDPVSVIAVQNFKGGVGKSTISTHLAQYLVTQGYRVLLIDCDSQASSTSLFGYVPDLDVGEDDTIYPFLREIERPNLRYAIRTTHWDGLSLIPSNLRLYAAEYELAARVARGRTTLLDRLSQGVASVSEDYDVVILDPPPALGTISLSVMRAANALLIPVPPTVMDFASTTAFFAMLDETIIALEEQNLPVDLSWIRIVLSRADDQKSMQREIGALMRKVYGTTLCRAALRDSAEIDNASARLMTVYELDQPATSRETHNRALSHLNAVSLEIETEIRKTWPSQQQRLTDEAMI
jgi:chromosome partitioning protein